MSRTYSFSLNGGKVTVDTDGSRMLVHVLRSDLGLSETKVGCGEGLCGACTVLLDAFRPAAVVKIRSIIVMGALIANAIHDAVGIRLPQLPMTPERIKKALKV